MGTRHIVGVKLGDKLFGQYGQWDGDPGGAGLIVFRFLQDRFDEETFRKNFGAAVFVDEDEAERDFTPYNHFSRNLGVGIVSYIQETPEPRLYNRITFAADSLFCEWAYIIDLDARVLRVFSGLNEEKLPEGAFFKFLEGRARLGKEYEPVAEIGSLTFDELALMFEEEFLITFGQSERVSQ